MGVGVLMRKCSSGGVMTPRFSAFEKNSKTVARSSGSSSRTVRRWITESAPCPRESLEDASYPRLTTIAAAIPLCDQPYPLRPSLRCTEAPYRDRRTAHAQRTNQEAPDLHHRFRQRLSP